MINLSKIIQKILCDDAPYLLIPSYLCIMEILKHECGVAIVRLLKPMSYYKSKYGTNNYGLNKLYLLMEKQHNRGQEAAGMGCVRLETEPGHDYIYRERAEGTDAIREIFSRIGKRIKESEGEKYTPYQGEVYLGHLRYSTTGKSGLSYVHPFMRRNNWRSQNLLLCGNFNMTNTEELFNGIVRQGQHPRLYADTFILLEQLGHALDKENQRLYEKYSDLKTANRSINGLIEENLDVTKILKEYAGTWDGGFVICGALGSGDVFALRDSHGIRPAFYYQDEEIVVLASERPVIQTVMNVRMEDVHELTPGSALIIDRKGDVQLTDILGEQKNERCSFERIYFSRGGDADIYKERKLLGHNLSAKVLNAIDGDWKHTVFSFIPNTAELAYLGLLEGIEQHANEQKAKEIATLDPQSEDYVQKISEIVSGRIRNEKIAFKDIKLRTFIAEGESRNDIAAHVYDVAYGIVKPAEDTLVVIDDSIVRGTTLKQSIIRMLDRLNPRRIIIVSSAPQVRYPDYYGIDMSRMNEFCAFRAAIALLKETGMQSVIDEVYKLCKEQLATNAPINYVKKIYEPFTEGQISNKIAKMLTPTGTNAEVKLVYQTLDGLHDALPGHPGDWYFSGDYPTIGGYRMISQAFVNYYEGRTNSR